MQRRKFIGMCLAGGGLAACAPAWSALPDVLRSGRKLIVADPHAHPDFMLAARRTDPTMPRLGDLKAAGVALSAFAAVGDAVYLRTGSGQPFENTREQLRRPLALAAQGGLRLVLGRDDLAALAPVPEVPFALLAIEGGDAFEGRLEHLEAFYRDGVRMVTLIHDRDNELGFNQRSAVDGPLSAFGVQVVERMNALGMLIDVAHARSQTLRSIIDASAAPVIDSHTAPFLPGEEGRGPRRLRPWEEMEWVARSGGLVCSWPLAVVGKNAEKTTLAHWAEEIVRMKSRLGIAHCGLGTDGGGGLAQIGVVRGWDSIASWPALANALLDAGLSLDEVEAFLGGNFLRLLGRVLR